MSHLHIHLPAILKPRKTSDSAMGPSLDYTRYMEEAQRAKTPEARQDAQRKADAAKRDWMAAASKGSSLMYRGKVVAVKDATNHMGEKEYYSYNGWKVACKAANPSARFEGDKEICNALPGVGEWDGEKGVVYKHTKDTKVKNSALTDKARAALTRHRMLMNAITKAGKVMPAEMLRTEKFLQEEVEKASAQDDEFKEEQHPREGGKFTKGSGGKKEPGKQGRFGAGGQKEHENKSDGNVAKAEAKHQAAESKYKEANKKFKAKEAELKKKDIPMPKWDNDPEYRNLKADVTNTWSEKNDARLDLVDAKKKAGQ